MTLHLSIPQFPNDALLKPKITVVGVGGAGGNAVNNMIETALDGVDFVVANTDAQAISLSRAERRIQLGIDTTQGLGAGARPDVGRHAADEAVDAIAQELQGSNMAFVTAGMGGGTGTGAAPVIARIARELGILTVGVVTKPFQFEGAHRMHIAETGIDELAQFVDTLIVIPNQNLFRVANEHTTFADAFKMADDVLNSGVRSVTDLMMMPGLINLDFADVQTVMQGMGRAMMGTGEAEGERRALDAAEAAIANPLLEDTSMRGANGVLINITGGSDITLFEVDEAANRIRDEVETDAHIIFGSCFDENLEGSIRVSVVATGIEAASGVQPRPALVHDETKAVPKLLAEPLAQRLTSNPLLQRAPSLGQIPGDRGTPQAPTLAPASATTQPPEADLAMTDKARQIKTELLTQPAQAAAVAAAVARAPVPPVTPSRADLTPINPQETEQEELDAVVAKASTEPSRSAQDQDQTEPTPALDSRSVEVESKKKPKNEGEKLSLFSRYRKLAKNRSRETTKKEELERPPKPTEAPSSVNISIDPKDRPVTSHNEEELEIPAFLRRQAN